VLVGEFEAGASFVKVELHNLVAECPSCHGTEFEPQGVKPELVASQTPMVCARCGAHTPYIALLIQIGDQAIARSHETLDRIKAERAKLKKPEPQGK
jgi:hypothetical protein